MRSAKIYDDKHGIWLIYTDDEQETQSFLLSDCTDLQTIKAEITRWLEQQSKLLNEFLKEKE